MSDSVLVGRKADALPRWAALALAGVIVVGAALRAWMIESRPIWVDEGLSILYATIDWTEVVDLRRSGTNPPLYHFLLSGWVKLFGTSAVAIRSLSLVFGLAALGTVFLLGRRLAGVRVAAVATGLLALGNLSVGYAQEARFYALLQFLSLLASLLLCRLMSAPRVGHAGAYALCLAALIWTHTYAWFVLAAHGVWLLAGLPSVGREQRRRLVLLSAGAVAIAVASFLPWLSVLREQVSGVRRGYWIEEPPWKLLAVCGRDLLVLERRMRWPLVTLTAVVVGWTLHARWRRPTGRSAAAIGDPVRRGGHECGRAAGGVERIAGANLLGLAAWAALPVLIPFAWSKIGTPVFQTKYAIASQAPTMLLVALLVTRRPVVGLLLLSVFTGFWPPNRDRDLVVEDWRGAAETLVKHTAEREPVFLYKDFSFFSLDHYLQGRRRVTPVFTEGLASTPFVPYYPHPAVTFERMLARIAEGEEPVMWLVLRWESEARAQSVREQIRRFRRVDSVVLLERVEVLRLSLPARAPSQSVVPSGPSPGA